MNVLTVKKVSTDDLAKKVIKNVKHNVHVLGNDRDFLYHEMNSKVTNTIKENQADGFLNDIKNAYYFKAYDLANLGCNNKYLSWKDFLASYDMYTVSDGLKIIKSILKKGYITLNSVLDSDINYLGNYNRSHIQLKNLETGRKPFQDTSNLEDTLKSSHQKYMCLDSLGNTYEYNDINDLISMLSNLTNYFKTKLSFITSKKGYKALLFCVTVSSIKQLPTNLEDQALTKFIKKLFNSKDSHVASAMDYMKETWNIDTANNWLSGLKHDIAQAKNQQYDGYKEDLATEEPHLKEVKNLANHGFKYIYEETPSNDKMYALDDSASGVTEPFFEHLYDAIFNDLR